MIYDLRPSYEQIRRALNDLSRGELSDPLIRGETVRAMACVDGVGPEVVELRLSDNGGLLFRLPEGTAGPGDVMAWRRTCGLPASEMSTQGPVYMLRTDQPAASAHYPLMVAGASGAIDCPVCSGKGALHFSRAGYNGHIHAKCTTPDCVCWME